MNPEELAPEDDEIDDETLQEFGFLVEEPETSEQRPGTEPVQTAPVAPPPPAPTLDAQTLEILDTLKRNPDALRRIAATPAPSAPVTPPAAVPDLRSLATEFISDFGKDPEAAVTKLLGRGQEYLNQEREKIRAEVSRPGLGVADMVIDNYINTVKADKSLDPEVATELEQQINAVRTSQAGVIASMGPREILAALEQGKATAMGKVTMRKGTPFVQTRVRERAPQYRTNAAPAPKRVNSELLPKTHPERELVRALKEANLKPKGIQEAIIEFREGR